MRFTATTTRGAEPVLAAELASFGAQDVAPGYGAVAFAGPLEVGYRACLWSRIASRVLLGLARFPAPHADALYEGVSRIPWEDHVAPDRTILVDFVGGSEQIRHSQFGARKVKDAVVDRLRGRRGERPSVDLTRPDVRINVHLREDHAAVSIDLSGDALHLRGGREAQKAPLKENLAAAILHIAGWPALAQAGASLVDPFCGSGTLPLEAAGIALDAAPGLRRERWGFWRWAGHDPRLWQRLAAEAQDRARQARFAGQISGFDQSREAIALAKRNAAAAGLDRAVTFRQQPLDALAAPPNATGLVLANPPYGARLGDEAELAPLYARLGDILRRRFLGWRAFILTGSPLLAKQVGLRPARRHVLHNGPIECRLLEIPIADKPPEGRPRWRE